MTSNEFVSQLRKAVIEDEVRFYQDTLGKSQNQNVTDRYWIELIQFYNSLDSPQQEILFKMVRQVSVDTVASLLGIIDGVSYFDGASGQLRLMVHGSQISGDLQERFFMQEHEGED